MFEPPRYGTRLVDAGLEIRLKSPMISEMVLWEWEIQEPRKVEEWRLPGRAPTDRPLANTALPPRYSKFNGF